MRTLAGGGLGVGIGDDTRVDRKRE